MGSGLSLGVLGGGQLGRMLALASYPLDIRCVFLDPSSDAPAGQVGEQLVGDWCDTAALERLAARASVATYEFESVPEASARKLAELGVTVLPEPDALRVSQDRLLEKSCFRELGIPTAEFWAVGSEAELDQAVAEIGLPAVLKTRRLGYDGKGQAVLRDQATAQRAFAELGGVPMILERWVSFDRELSIIAARGRTGELVFYPLVENHHKHGILRVSVCPAPRVTPDLQQMAEAHARALLERLGYVGVLALELFDVRGTLLANEFAPRVHNSGHLTIEGSATSQFENHVRAVMGLPLGSTHSTAPTTMVNLIGGVPDRASILALPDTHLHLYGKASRRARKVGHITVQAENEALLGERVQALMPLVLAAEDG